MEKILIDALSSKDVGAEEEDRQLVRQRAREVRHRAPLTLLGGCLHAGEAMRRARALVAAWLVQGAASKKHASVHLSLLCCGLLAPELRPDVQVEDALYSFCKGATAEYTEKAKALKYNIANNKELREDILSQEVEADTLVAMKSTDLADRNKKSARETAKKESLQEAVNSDELKRLKDAAAGMEMRKTDAGLAVVDTEAEKAKKEEEERERRKAEEERARAEAAGLKKHQQTLIKVDITQIDESAYVNSEYTPRANGRAKEDSDDEDAQKDTELLMDSPVLTAQPEGGIDVEPLEGDDGLTDESGFAGAVWQGELDCRSTKRALLFPEQQFVPPFKLAAFALQEEGELHNPIHLKLHVQGYISLSDMEKYIATKRKTPEVKMVLAFKLVPRPRDRVQYDRMLEEMTDRKKGMCLIDDRNWGGLLYALPSTSSSVSSLLPYGEDDYLVAVAITDRKKREAPPKRQQPDDIHLDVTNDIAKANFSQEKTASLKLKKSSFNLRLRAIAGDNELHQIPENLEELEKVAVGDAIDYLLSQKVSVMEVEPEREKDEEEHLKLMEYLVAKERASVVLDTEKAIMYLLPPVDEAGKLLDPPAASCDNMLAVLLLSDTSAGAGQDSSAQSIPDTGFQAQNSGAIPFAPVQPREPVIFTGDSVSTQWKEKGEERAKDGMAPRNMPSSTHMHHARLPDPVSVPRALGGAQTSPYAASPRPAYDSLQSPGISAPPRSHPVPSAPAPAPPSRPAPAPPPAAPAAVRGWNAGPKREPVGGRGWQDNGVYHGQGPRGDGGSGGMGGAGRFLGEQQRDDRQWNPRNGPQNTQPQTYPPYLSPMADRPPYPMGERTGGGMHGGQRSAPFPQGSDHAYGGWNGGTGNMGRAPGPNNTQNMSRAPGPNNTQNNWYRPNGSDPRVFRR